MIRVPRITYGREGSIHRWAAEGELMHGQFAEQDRARLSQFHYSRRVMVGDPVFQDRGMTGRPDVLGHVEILECDRNAVQQSAIFSGPQFLLRLFRLPQSQIGGQRDETMESAIDRFAAF